MKKIPPIKNGEWLLDLRGMKESITNETWNRIYDYSYNGLLVDSLDTAAFPIAWDAGMEVKGDRLVILGGAGPSGYGKVRIEIPLRDAFSGSLVKYSVEPRMEYVVELLAVLEEMGIVVLE